MIELVDRLEAEDERREAVLFEDDRGEERGFVTMRAAVAHNPAEAAQRRASSGLLVVRELVKVPLHGERRPQPLDEPPLTCCKT